MRIDWQRIEFFFQTFLFRISFVVFFLLFIGVFYYAYHVEKTVEPVGENAPFPTQTAILDDTLETDPVTEPHRTRREMQVWIVEAVSELLNIDSEKRDIIMEEAKPYFTDEGYKQYRGYLNTNNLFAEIGKGAVTLSAIVDQTPQVLNEGLISGKYRWLYDVPIVMSVIPATGAAQNQQAVLRVQLARVDETVNAHRIVIESWSVGPRR